MYNTALLFNIVYILKGQDWGWRNGSTVKSTIDLAESLSSIPSTQVGKLNNL